jgi:hypothetical protein
MKNLICAEAEGSFWTRGLLSYRNDFLEGEPKNNAAWCMPFDAMMRGSQVSRFLVRMDTDLWQSPLPILRPQ